MDAYMLYTVVKLIYKCAYIYFSRTYKKILMKCGVLARFLCLFNLIPILRGPALSHV